MGLENVALWHERDISHSSAERVALPDAFLAIDYMLDRFAWLVEGLVVRPERMRANLEATGGLFFSQRLLLALVASGLTRDDAYRLVQRQAMRAWDEGLDFRSLSRADPEIAARVDLAAVFDLTSYTRHVDEVFARMEPRTAARGGPRVSGGATHVGSGKVREIYALDDDTLALEASDRISTFDVVLPTPIPDKGRVLTGLSAFWFARTATSSPNHLLSLQDDGRTMVCRRLEMLPIECVVRGYLAGSGWKDYSATGAVCGHALPAGLERVGSPSRADLHAGDEGRRGARREHRRGARSGALRRGAATQRAEARARRSTGFGAAHAEARGIILADTKFEFGVAPDGAVVLGDEALTPDSSRFWPAEEFRPGSRSPRSTSSSSATGARRPAGTRSRPGPNCPTTSSPARARATSRRSSGSRRSRSPSTSSDPSVVL